MAPRARSCRPNWRSCSRVLRGCRSPTFSRFWRSRAWTRDRRNRRNRHWWLEAKHRIQVNTDSSLKVEFSIRNLDFSDPDITTLIRWSLGFGLPSKSLTMSGDCGFCNLSPGPPPSPTRASRPWGAPTGQENFASNDGENRQAYRGN